jgi:hypothetical protein
VIYNRSAKFSPVSVHQGKYLNSNEFLFCLGVMSATIVPKEKETRSSESNFSVADIRKKERFQ